MTPFLADQDFTLYVGDVLDVLAELEDESVDCVITSPPYWGLRDYGTGSWVGGDGTCDHAAGNDHRNLGFNERYGRATGELQQEQAREFQYRDTCGKCGATRTDQQLGLEPTPELYVERMVTVFREVRRVLAGHGSLWLNMGDSYAGGGRGGHSDGITGPPLQGVGNSYPSSFRGMKPKDLVGVPWRLAFALQSDGWYLRSDIVWSKPNPMPESVTDRPTKSHEYVFLLSKRPRYFFDQEAVREPNDAVHMRWLKNKRYNVGGTEDTKQAGFNRAIADGNLAAVGRNVRSVWEIATQPFPEAHFATFPEELVRRSLLAGCPEGGTVLDPFMGSGTTALVARKHGRHAVGIELNPEYAQLCRERTRQLSLLAEGAV